MLTPESLSSSRQPATSCTLRYADQAVRPRANVLVNSIPSPSADSVVGVFRRSGRLRNCHHANGAISQPVSSPMPNTTAITLTRSPLSRGMIETRITTMPKMRMAQDWRARPTAARTAWPIVIV